MQNVVVETVPLVPEGNSFAAEIVHGVRDVDEVLKEFAGDSFIRLVLSRQFESDRQHVEAIHPHPARAVRLLDVAAGGKWRGAVEDADIVETEESALENVHSLGILAIHPPREIE